MSAVGTLPETLVVRIASERALLNKR